MPKKSRIRHSLAHILAAAVQELYPKVKFGIGPAIENGFYYDFNLPRTLTPEDLFVIEKKMRELVGKNLGFQKKLITKTEARKIFKNQPYKLELIKEKAQTKSQKISIYQTGNFIDFCSGPHIKSTKEINPDAFKLERIAGAYWKGDEKNPMLTRIYGLAFETKKELNNYLLEKQEIEKRSHLVLGEKLELFSLSTDVGSGLILWLPKGAILRKTIEDFILSKYLKNGYQLVISPHIGSEKLFSLSGHLKHYQNYMYSPIEIDKEKYYLKPMNCPFHLMIYKKSLKSYRDLPVRYTELGTVYRYEKSGVLHGLTRVRGLTQDDGHIICRHDQLEDEIEKAIKLTKEVLKKFGFKNFYLALSVRDSKNKKKYLGDDLMWEKAENALAKGIRKAGWKFQKEEGEAVFYGPKMDVKVKDVLNREWQISTLQVDFNLPERFDIFYIDKNSNKQRPFMLHRALLGSLERFIGLLIEHYKGAFPVWLSPVQTIIIPISEKFNNYGNKVLQKLKENNIRAEIDNSKETLGKRIRNAELQKIPYILVVGEKEIKSNTVAVRSRESEISAKSKEQSVVRQSTPKLEKFLEQIRIENAK